MVFSTWLGLNTASRGIAGAQRGLDTASHNIANANTPGYSRQRVNLVASPALAHPSLTGILPGQIGQGVDVASITRIRDTFLDQVYRHQQGGFGLFESQTLSFSTLETVLNEPSETGISTLIDRFFQDWNAVANTPEALPTRAALRETASTMAASFQSVDAQLVALRDQQNDQIRTRVQQANGIIGQIADLNRQVISIEGVGQQANDLKDRRDLLIDDLSKIMNVTVKEQGQGSVDVLLGGVQLVAGVEPTFLEATSTLDESGHAQTTVQLETGVPIVLGTGEIAGFIKMRDEVIPALHDRLNQLATGVINRINQLHKAHFGLDGTRGRAFFEEIITQTRTGTNLATAFPAITVDADTRLSELGITPGDFEIQGATVTITPADLDPAEGATVGELLERINSSQNEVRAELVTDFTGTRVVFTLYNPPDRTTEIELNPGTSNFMSVLGQDSALNVDAPGRATYTTSMDQMRISGAIEQDLGAIAAAGEAESGGFAGEGDNQGALSIAELQDSLTIFKEGGSFDGFFHATVSLLGTQSQANTRQLLNQQALTQQIDGQRQSVFGVNLDEEAVDLIKYQKAFEASARVIATLQVTYDAILGLTG